jgi:hypothetical protein
MSQKNQTPKSGLYEDYSDKIAKTLEFCKRKAGECPKGVTFHLSKVDSGKGHTYRLKLQFVNPTTDHL